MSQKDIGNKIPIYKLKAGKEVEDYYDVWTVENKYDKDMVDWKYSGPQETIDLFKKHNPKKDIKILNEIHNLVKEKGFTIKGANSIMKSKDNSMKQNEIVESLIKIKKSIENLKERI